MVRISTKETHSKTSYLIKILLINNYAISLCISQKSLGMITPMNILQILKAFALLNLWQLLMVNKNGVTECKKTL